jgi:dihydroneopterin aldolase
MTGFLASVTGAEEAGIVISMGADVIDLKNPAQGALGALGSEEVRAIMRFVAGRRPVSATVGDLPMKPDVLSDAVMRMAACGVDIVKVGFFGQKEHAACVAALAPHALHVNLVAVLFADQAPTLQILRLLAEAGFLGVMLDTIDKVGGGLTNHMSLSQLRGFVDAARAEGLLVGLAGSLRLRDIAVLCPLQPDFLGFRGALCQEGRRVSRIDPRRVGAVSRLLRQYNMGAVKKSIRLQNRGGFRIVQEISQK